MDEITVNVYDTNADKFAAQYASADMAVVHRLLLWYLPPSARILEIGCGTGRDAAFLADNGFDVVATDASAEMMAHCRRLPAPGLDIGDYVTGLTTQGGSIRLLNSAFPLPPDSPLFSDKFKAVVCLAMLMHLPDSELFEFAYQIRQLLETDGTVILSVSNGRDNLAEYRDDNGRLFCERPPAEIALLFERLGFQLLAQEKSFDGLGRDSLCWTTLVLRLTMTGGTRPVDQIETIINRDRKTATYKLALLRALCDIAQTATHHVRWHDNETVCVPLGLIAERWLYYYWPLVDADITQIRGQGKRNPEAFRASMKNLLEAFNNVGGLDAFNTAYRNNQLTAEQRRLADSVLNKIANTIVVGPVTFSGGALKDTDQFFTHSGRKTAKGKCSSPTELVENLGRVHFRAEIWRELCLVGHWIGEAILLRWAELTHEFTKQSIPLALILEKLLVRPESQRDVTMMRRLYASFEKLDCVWTGQPLKATGTDGAGFAVDHVIPFSLWHNNELWNLLPSDSRVNGQKSDRIVTRDTLRASEERIIHYWQVTRSQATFRFDCEVSRTLLGRNVPEAQWEKPAFTALMDATEMVAIQRGVERWSAPTAVKQRVPQVRTPKPAPVQRLFSFGEISSGEHFKTALPMVGNLAAGPLSAGFKAISLDDVEECDWIKVPAKFAKPGRFVIRIAGDSMEPLLHVGDYAIFEYHRTPRQSGQVVIVAEFAESEPGQVAVKRYKADAAAWIFTADNPNRTGIRLEKTSVTYPILGTYVTKLP
ncbi:MAG: methyltransferase domain-containing protein [Bacteroidales bacterium]|nr:methyltransferase domain-containing protein [Bacteroidales bacterium]